MSCLHAFLPGTAQLKLNHLFKGILNFMFNVYDSLYDRQLQMVTPNEDNSIVLAQDWNENKIYADTTKAASLLADSSAMSLFKQFLILETVVESEVFHVVKLKLKILYYCPPMLLSLLSWRRRLRILKSCICCHIECSNTWATGKKNRTITGSELTCNSKMK